MVVRLPASRGAASTEAESLSGCDDRRALHRGAHDASPRAPPRTGRPHLSGVWPPPGTGDALERTAAGAPRDRRHPGVQPRSGHRAGRRKRASAAPGPSCRGARGGRLLLGRDARARSRRWRSRGPTRDQPWRRRRSQHRHSGGVTAVDRLPRLRRRVAPQPSAFVVGASRRSCLGRGCCSSLRARRDRTVTSARCNLAAWS